MGNSLADAAWSLHGEQKRYRAETGQRRGPPSLLPRIPRNMENDIDTQRYIDEKAFGNALLEFMK